MTARDFLYIGRKYNLPIAYEGALKLKEISYIHAEGCGAGEMKHGSIAMIDKDFPTLAIATQDSVYEKMLSNIQQIKARKGPVVAIATEGIRKSQNLRTMYSTCRKRRVVEPDTEYRPPAFVFVLFLSGEGTQPQIVRAILAKSVTVE